MTETADGHARKFNEIDAPPQIRVSASQSAEISLTWKISRSGNPARFEREDGYLMCLRRTNVPKNPRRIDGRSVVMPRMAHGQSLLADLNRKHTKTIHTAISCISFHVSRGAIDRFLEEHGLPKVAFLRAVQGAALDDPMIENLGNCLLPAFQRPEAANQLFVDYVALALLAHLVTRYGEREITMPPARGGLAPWQERRTKEMLLASIDGKIGLDELAKGCGLSRSHFARAFKTTTGMSPLRWLHVQRINRAKDLLLNSALPVDQIALQCGFADQSHFTRAFLKAVNATPGAWRRRGAR
ncbi:helix-turn-helix domain-containing protein [Phyllobacterium phragmitis]|uniref:AraC family transcriptional regulator n=1 Tax=Phyllobacterium phragmitis TaxID=2670329 RepID=A0ABQ0H5F6_9HYPH